MYTFPPIPPILMLLLLMMLQLLQHPIFQITCTVTGDLNRNSTHCLSLLGLYNIVTFNTRLHSKLDHLFVNCKGIFKAPKRAPLSTSDHNIRCALPCIYSHTHTVFTSPFQLLRQMFLALFMASTLVSPLML